MVLLYAVSLSSSDTITFVISSILTRDIKIIQKVQRAINEKYHWIYMVSLTILACVVGVFYQKLPTSAFL